MRLASRATEARTSRSFEQVEGDEPEEHGGDKGDLEGRAQVLDAGPQEAEHTDGGGGHPHIDIGAPAQAPGQVHDGHLGQ
jgi:hypothetical protein